MIKLVVIDTKTLDYRIFEGNKCVAHFQVQNGVALTAEAVEVLRTENYCVA